jgi:lambda family phage tail tape measure protein
MATNSLGTLTLDLIAKVGGFTGPLDQAAQNAKKRNAEISKSFASLAKGIGVAVGSVPAILTALTIGAANSAKEISNLSSVAGLSTTEFQKLSAGAATVGIANDKLSDIFKDVNDKVGDFLNTGAGPLADFFTNIAPMVGVTADQFRKLNSADALQLYVSSLQKAGASQKEMTFYMEAIANDATGLIPLLRDGGKGFKEFGDAAEAAGVILDTKSIEAGRQFSIELSNIAQLASSAQTAVAAELLPVLLQFSKDVKQAATDAGGLGPAVRRTVKEAVEAISFIVDAGDGAARVFKLISAEFDGLVSSASGSIIAGVYQTLHLLDKLPGVDLGEQLKDLEGSYNKQVDAAADATNRMRAALETPLAGSVFSDYYKKAEESAEAAAKAVASIPEGPGTGVDPEKIKAAAAATKKAQSEAAAAAKKQASDAAAAAKQIEDTFKSTETDYERQIQLINITADKRKDASEISQLAFELESGKLVGINALQQERLKSLADELDSLHRLKQANEDAAKLAAFTNNLSTSNQTAKDGFDQELAGAGGGDKYKERLKQFLSIRQDFNAQMRDLQEQQNSGDISTDLYELEIEALEKAQEEKLAIQQDYYEKIDQAQNDWLDGVTDAWQNYSDTASNYSQIASDQISSQLGTLQSSFGDAISAMVLENQSLSESFHNIVNSMVSSLVKGLADMLAQYVINQGLKFLIGSVGDAAAIAAATSTGSAIASAYAPAAAAASLASFGANSIPAIAGMVAANTASKGFALSGMAHDGIDSVPQDGTWFLQTGERVTTAETSAKLDRTLSEIQSRGNSNAGAGQVNHFTISLPNATDERNGRESGAAASRKIARALKNTSRYT